MALVAVVVVGGWQYFGARLVRRVIVEQGSALIGSQVDVGQLTIRLLAPAIDVRDFAVADPDDLMRNRLAIGRAVIELELLPLLQRRSWSAACR